jgi:hypothetical protein
VRNQTVERISVLGVAQEDLLSVSVECGSVVINLRFRTQPARDRVRDFISQDQVQIVDRSAVVAYTGFLTPPQNADRSQSSSNARYDWIWWAALAIVLVLLIIWCMGAMAKRRRSNSKITDAIDVDNGSMFSPVVERTVWDDEPTSSTKKRKQSFFMMSPTGSETIVIPNRTETMRALWTDDVNDGTNTTVESPIWDVLLPKVEAIHESLNVSGFAFDDSIDGPVPDQTFGLLPGTVDLEHRDADTPPNAFSSPFQADTPSRYASRTDL